MFKCLFIAIALAARVLSGVPSVSWTADLQPAGEQGEYELTLTGSIAPGYNIHPLSDPYSAPSLEFADGVSSTGLPRDEYVPVGYKGETVVEGSYVLMQTVRPGEHGRVAGTVSWQACSGDICNMPEMWEFSLDVPKTGERASLLAIILEAILWGLAMLLTPCVFPMVPLTVSFFLKGSDDRRKGRFRASMYGLFIVLLYTVPVCVIIGLTLLFGGESVTADIFNWLSTHWLPNILFFLIFMVFAASFFGAFELTLPSKWVNASDGKAGHKSLGGVFFLALTLVLVSFSCTGPIVGTVLIKSTRGEFWTPMVTMLAFSVAFALPFTAFAFFPPLLKNLPKSGGWLNTVKVTLGFLELALGLKFLSTADQTYHWHLLDREVYLAVWIVIFSLMGLYLLGKIRFAGDAAVEHLSVGRLLLSIAVFSFVLYMIPGLWGAPLKALSGYLPPVETQDFVADRYAPPEHPGQKGPTVRLAHGLVAYDNIGDALSEAAVSGKHVLVDITGYGCVNCREMEARVWSDSRVLPLLRDDFVLVALYNDDKTRLPEGHWVTTGEGKVLKDVGRVNSWIARTRFGVNAQPNYVILDSDGRTISPVRGYDLSVEGFAEFLNTWK